MGDMWEEFVVFHHKFIDWATVYYNTILTGGEQLSRDKVEQLMKELSPEGLEEVFQQSPYYKATANDVDWLEKVNMQGQMQKWVDHSISVTVNVPKETTIETVEKIYTTAWESGCKGCTIYRDGCRDGVLNHIKKEEEVTYSEALERPEVLECDIFYKTAIGKDWTVIVGLLKDKPYEIFAFDQLTQIEFPREIKKGKLVRVKGKYYRLIGDRGDKVYTIENIIDRLNEDEKTSTRRYSLALRNRINPLHISEQIDKYATISSFDKVIGRVLKTYIPATETGEKCEQCGGTIMMQDGCKKCLNCGYAKCG
jgi:ribonucleoside-diphosphate reductase alpha chain